MFDKSCLQSTFERLIHTNFTPHILPLNIVLIEPEIPNNTGNIGRLALAAGARLHLVKPFGFELSDARLKRAGLDYWQHLDVQYYEHQAEFFEQHPTENIVFLSSHGKKAHYEIQFDTDIFLVFGKESVGLPKALCAANEAKLYTIPMHSKHIRSLNLANSVAIVIFEGLRQLGG